VTQKLPTPYDLYLEHMARTVLGLTELDHLVEVEGHSRLKRLIRGAVRRTGFVLARPQGYDAARLESGIDVWPEHALTMVGRKRLDNIRTSIEAVLSDEVPGDYLEAGVWRGGASLFAKAVIAANGVTDRSVWLADSFAGLPAPNVEEYPADAGWDFSGYEILSASLDRVRNAFEWHGLLDERVHFLRGWFKDTLKDAPVESLAVLRLDGDLYESTMDVLEPLYPKVSSGGFVIVDDYGIIDACQRAVDDYRAEHEIQDSMFKIDDGGGWFWRKA
jgi:O-methyltransferase